ncbi:MAG: hypothetical protein JO337_14060 [Acidimicrobiales bacterium]|nr:hypothetical protein [Acidimicrobiales bacterium]
MTNRMGPPFCCTERSGSAIPVGPEPSLGILADVSLDPHPGGPWPPPLPPCDDRPAARDRREAESHPRPAVPTGAWGRPAVRRRRLGPARTVVSPLRGGAAFTAPPPAPPGYRASRLRATLWLRWPRLTEGVLAVALVALLAALFAPPGQHTSPETAWTTRAAPVVQLMLNDVAVLEQTPAPVSSPAWSDLARNLSRAQRLPTAPDPAVARLWATARDELITALGDLRATGVAGSSVEADLTAAGDTLLALARQL